ncbi:MAG: DUF5103 domain-containing protein [Chitinophagaceae bacterium]|nr:DUF5103 domain-containing protein [Chitinophagaceae bacterium]
MRRLILFFCICSTSVTAQLPDYTYSPNIATVRFHMYGNQTTLPIYTINSNDQLELHFDDLQSTVKNYYYTYQLCDYNWIPVNLNPFDYIKGFTQQRISNYRYSSVAFTKYTHYQAILPEKNSTPIKSGNYLVKVYLDGDTSKVAFTRRLLVLDPKTAISGKVLQPFASQLFKTHQKLQFNVNIKGINTFSAAQQIKVVILKNNRWDNAQKDIPPTFVKGNTLEYNTENYGIFPGGKEWRWLDLRSFRLQSDRVDSAEYKKDSTSIYLKPDMDRNGQRYSYFADLNGMFNIETLEFLNPLWQGDYATVHFSFVPPNGQAYTNKNIYLTGQLTNYEFNDKTAMNFNAAKGIYETTVFLKQGYYNYEYTGIDKNDPSKRHELEGDYWETENLYTILVYYKSFTDRADQLIGAAKVNSRTDRPGVSF